VTPHRLFLTDGGLQVDNAPLTQRALCSVQTVGETGGSWCPFGRGPDQAGDQQADDARSLLFETRALDTSVEILGAAIVTLDIAADRPIANLAIRLCDVHPSGHSLRVSYGILNLTHRDSSDTPTPLEPGRRYRIRVQLNDAGATFPAGHRVRLALSTSYWPIIWPSPEIATVTIFGGCLDLPVRSSAPEHARLAPLPGPETAEPEPVTVIRPGVVRIDRLNLELGTQGNFAFHIDDGDPLSAVAEMHRTESITRDLWQVRTETHIRLSCTRDAFLLRATMQAWDGEDSVCHREWDVAIPRDHV
jgi:hypothetical protein